jgi:hypothetical protein
MSVVPTEKAQHWAATPATAAATGATRCRSHRRLPRAVVGSLPETRSMIAMVFQSLRVLRVYLTAAVISA